MVTTIFIHIYFTASNAENLACTVPTTAWGMYLLPFYVFFTATWATSSRSLLTYCNCCCCCCCYSYIVICLWLVCPVLHSTPTDPDIICRPCWIDGWWVFVWVVCLVPWGRLVLLCSGGAIQSDSIHVYSWMISPMHRHTGTRNGEINCCAWFGGKCGG